MSRKFNILIFTLVCMLLSFSGAQDKDAAEKTDGGLTEDKIVAAIDNSTDNATVTVNVEKPDMKKVPFSWKVIPNDTLLNINDSLSLNCVAESEGLMGELPSYEWTTGDDETIPVVLIANASNTDLNVWSFENGTLVIKRFSENVAGKYTCKVKSYLKKTVTIALGKPVTVGNLPDQAEKVIGCNLTIQCIASGDGTIEGSWRFGEEEKEINDSEGTKSVTRVVDGSTYHLILHINGATAEDSDNYTCEFTNEFDPSAQKKKISIEFIENTQNESCSETKIVANLPHSTIEKAETEDDYFLVYVVPLVVVLALVLIAIIIAVAFIIRRRRLQQNAVFSGVKYRRTEGNDEGIRA